MQVYVIIPNVSRKRRRLSFQMTVSFTSFDTVRKISSTFSLVTVFFKVQVWTKVLSVKRKIFLFNAKKLNSYINFKQRLYLKNISVSICWFVTLTS